MSVATKLSGKVVVVAGASGVVGSGAVRRFLDAGATVVGISRSADKLAGLRKSMTIGAKEPFHGVVGDFGSEAAGEATLAAVGKELGNRGIDHLVSSLGFITVEGVTTATSLASFKASLDDSLFNTFVAAKTFLPGMKARTGATYTIISGGFSHGVFAPNLWMATIKNASLNNLVLALAAETEKDAVRVNSACIHMGVAPVGGKTNQLGMPSDRDTLSMGDALVGLTLKAPRGQIVCLANWEDADKWAKEARA